MRPLRPEPRPRWLPWLLVGCTAAISIVAGIVVSRSGPEPVAKSPRRSGESAGVQVLRDLLRKQSLCMVKAERVTILRRAQLDLPTYQPDLLAVLRNPAHELFTASCALAADLRLHDALAALGQAAEADTGKARLLALATMDAIEPLAGSVLVDLLRSDEAATVTAALQMLGRRGELPVDCAEAVFAVCTHPDAAIRATALQQLPPALGEEHAAAVLGLLDSGADVALVRNLLARLPVTEATTAVVVDRLPHLTADELPEWTPVLQAYGQDPAVRRLLWEIAGRDGEDESLRAGALMVLELAADQTPLPVEASSWPPLLAYHAARVRIAGGDLAGVDALMVLAFGQDEHAAGLSRAALGRLSGLPPHAEAAELTAWRATLLAVPPGALTPQ